MRTKPPISGQMGEWSIIGHTTLFQDIPSLHYSQIIMIMMGYAIEQYLFNSVPTPNHD